MRNSTMPDSNFSAPVTRPTMCPYCKGKIIDTLAKVITVTSVWRCRECDQTWTIGRGPFR
jgi:ribosomal protein L37AE/L43A